MMKAELPMAPQSALLNLRVKLPVGAILGEQGEAVRAAQTRRPASQAETPAETRNRSQGHHTGSEPAKTGAQRTRLRFSVDDDSGRMVVSVVDRDTSEVVRQLPAEELLAVARHIEEQLKTEGHHGNGLLVQDEA